MHRSPSCGSGLNRFKAFEGEDWPTTTLPAFEVAWCAAQQGEAAFLAFDLRVRQAFFAESRNIGRRDILLELAQEVGLDLASLTREWDSGRPREAVLADQHMLEEGDEG